MDLTRTWLNQILNPYYNKDRTFFDVDRVLSSFTGLKPKTDSYRQDDGKTLVLLCLHGTIPVTYRESSYNIPIAIWIPLSYPMQAPIPFVVPTAQMLLRPGRHIDSQGKFYHPVLANWHLSAESNLLQLIAAMQDVFKAEPPVYSKPTNPGFSPPAATRAFSPQPSQSVPIPSSSPSKGTPAGQPASKLGSSPSFASPPSYPAGTVGSPPQATASQVPFPAPNFAKRNTSPLIPSTALPRSQSASPPGPLIQMPRPPSLIDSQNYSAPSVPSDDQSAKLSQLRYALRDKLRDRQAQAQQRMRQEMESLLLANKQLNEGRFRIDDVFNRLVGEEHQIQKNIQILKEKSAEIEQFNQELSNKPDPGVDDILAPVSAVHAQLLEALADDQAIDDTIYQLREALSVKKIDLANFMRIVRNLSREQFMKRALILKIQGQLATPSMGYR
ncbi:UEV domain-containing protein [Polychytrium aggregatum]|uniref:UEV domain-containing protein n=1 Tax=Polychytrium aggregatum TaxID=110093 RepID=UPI0022FDECBA|nr:UEV domain-containing protein [Polychytrium aggregatum]KAI9209599.1 UEV domain-containing protein [Polychytrium aggregatum]